MNLIEICSTSSYHYVWRKSSSAVERAKSFYVGQRLHGYTIKEVGNMQMAIHAFTFLGYIYVICYYKICYYILNYIFKCNLLNIFNKKCCKLNLEIIIFIICIYFTI